MSELDSQFEPHGSSLPENNLLDPNSTHDILTATAGFSSDLDSIVKKRTASSQARLSELRAATMSSTVPSGDESLRRGKKSPVLYNPDTKKFAVAGNVFDEEDFQSAVDSEGALLDPNAQPVRPDGGNWRSVPTHNFIEYINKIKNPTREDLFKRNFKMGTQQLKSLGGNALSAVGFEEFGGDIAEEADRRAAFYQPFVREFTEINPSDEGGAGRAVDWFVSVLGSQGPQILESVAAAGVGALAGTATAGPGMGTFGGFIAGLFGKKEFKERVAKAASEYRSRQAKGMSRKEIMSEIPEEMKLLKSASAAAGATIANVASGYAMGTGDIYGEAIDQGFESGEARVRALFGAVPYAALESLPEVVAAARLLRAPAVRGVDKLPKGASTLRKLGSKAGDVAKGVAGIGALEGVTEAGQESLNMLLTNQDLTTPEAINRLINAAAAGVAVGGVMGGISSLTSRKSNQLDQPVSDTEEHDLLGLPAPEPKVPPPTPVRPNDPSSFINLNAGLDGGPAAQLPATRNTDLAVAQQPLEGELLGPEMGGPGIGEQRKIKDSIDAEAIDGVFELTGDPEFDQAAIEIGLKPSGKAAALPAPVTAAPAALGDASLRQGVSQQAATPVTSGDAKLRSMGGVQDIEDMPKAAWEATRKGGQGGQPVWDKVPEDVQKSWRSAVDEGMSPADLEKLQQETLVPYIRKNQNRGRKANLDEYVFDNEADAKAAAKELGITGFHTNEDGTIMPGENHEVLGEAVRENRKVNKKPTESKKQEQVDEKEPDKKTEKSAPAATADKPAAAPVAEAVDATAQAAAVGKAMGDALEAMFTAVTGQINAVTEQIKAKVEQVDLELDSILDEAESKSKASKKKPEEQKAEDRKRNVQEKAVDSVTAEKAGALVDIEPTNQELLDSMEDVKSSDPKVYDALRYELQIRAFVGGYAKNAETALEAWVEVMQLPKDGAWYTGMIRIAMAEKTIDIKSVLGQFIANERRNNTPYWALVKDHVSFTTTEVTRPEYTKDAGDKVKVSAGMKLAMSLASKLEVDASTFRANPLKKKTALGRKEEYKKLYAQVVEAGHQDFTMANGVDRISDYFNADGELNTNELDNPVSYEMSEEEKQASREVRNKNEDTVKRMTLAEAYEDLRGRIPNDMLNQTLKDLGYNPQAVNAISPQAELRDQADALTEAEFLSLEDIDSADLAMQDRDSLMESYDDGDGRYRRVDDDAPIGKMTLGEVTLTAQAFISKLRIKPTFTFVRNAADLQSKNPALYKMINEGRPAKDLGEVRAAGVSYKDNVVIFSDNIVSVEDLNFILGHETIGHFGLRSMLPPNVLNAALDKIYNEVDYISAAVDEVLQTERAKQQKMSKREAVEEYLADMAGVLPGNVISRFWNFIKAALRKAFGKPLPDDFARYLISQSRRYVRNGKMAPVDIIRSKIGTDMAKYEGMTDPDSASMYAFSKPYYAERNMAAGGSARDMLNWAGAVQYMSDKGVNTKDLLDRILGQLKTMNYSARENLGYEKFYLLMRAMVQRVNELRTKYNHGLKILLEPMFEPFGIQIGGGMSKAEYAKVNEMLRHTTRAKMGKVSEEKLREYKIFTYKTDGRIEINYKVIEDLSKLGRMTLKDFRKGFTYTKLAPKMMSDNPAEGTRIIEANRKKALAEATSPEEEAVINADFDAQIENDFYYVEVEDSMPAQPKLTKDSLIWKGYNAAYDTSNQADTDLLIANIDAFFKQEMSGHKRVEEVLGRDLTLRDKEFLRLITARYAELQAAGISNNNDDAYQFIVEFNMALIGKDTDRIAPFVGKWIPNDGARISQGINELRAGSVLPGNTKESLRYNIQHIIQTEGALHTSVSGADKFAKNSIANGHMPLGRPGGWQVYIKAVDPVTGQVYKVHEEFRNQFAYVRTENKAEALHMAESLSGALNVGNYAQEKPDGEYTDKDKFDENAKTMYEIMVEVEEAIVLPDGTSGGRQKVYRKRKVHLVPTAEVARENQPDPMGANLNEVVSTLQRLGVQLHPKARERLVKNLTAQNSRARDRLQRAGAPGENLDMVRFLSEKLEGLSSTVARKEYRNDVAELMDISGNQWARDQWMGSEEDYRAVKAAWKKAENDPNVPSEVKQMLKRNFDRHHYTYVVKDSQHKGNRYLDMASRDLAFLQAQNSVEFSDFASGDLGSAMRMWTTIAQLGGSVATGVLNIIGLQTNVVPVLAVYNPKTNFGGGFGLAKSQQELMHALSQVKSPGQSDAQYWYDLLVVTDNADPRLIKDAKKNAEAERNAKAAGFTQVEVQFMYDEVRQGTMAAALMNAMLGSARGKVTSGAAQKSIQAWMSMFSYTEQAGRRGTGLAAFRLYYARGKQEYMKDNKITDESKIPANVLSDLQKKAKEAATDTIDQALGEYAMFNRPAIWRGGVQQFIFMYKMFPLISITLFSQLPKKGQLMFLGTLLLLAGIKGLPFAEDIFDLVDTIGQGLGLGPSALWKGSAERTVAEALHAVHPDLSAMGMRGLVNTFMGINMSDRASVGNIVPGTGLGLAGADVGRELLEVAGPMASFVANSLATTGNAMKYAAEVVGLKDDTTTIDKVMREAPFTMARAFGDMLAYNHADAIVNSQGYVVDKDVVAGTYLARALGFYPAVATRHNDVVRVSKRVGDYTKELTAAYRARYISARIANDREAEDRVIKMVENWNKVARGTGMEIPDFTTNANKAYQLATQSTSDRYLKTVSSDNKDAVELIMKVYGFDE